MLRASLLLILLVCLNGWCAAQIELSAELPPLPDFKPVTELPADIPTCEQSDININECIKRAFQKITPRLKDGIKELNIPPMDPFIIERNNIELRSGFATGRVQVRNVRIFGISDSVVQSVDHRMDGDKVSMGLVTQVPRLYLEGNYKADMMINEVKMTPKGYFNVTMTDLVLSSQSEGELYERDGHTYLRLTKFNFEPEIGDMQIYASNLVPDPALNAVILDFVNQYWRQVYKIMLPQTRSTWEPMFLKVMNSFFAAIPFDLFIKKN
uniref:Circadian clock-controlled protein n=1 Tax=Bactrocera dorsalis TaxID=27457 RepID=A0A034WI37_BACDO